jgi:hypothetical protein
MKIIITESSRNRLVFRWLNKEFGDLTPIVKGNITFYVDKDRLPLFYYYQDSKNGYVNISYDRIWVFFDSIFGLNYLQTREILTIWLEETYNLRGLIPNDISFEIFGGLEETYNLRGLIPQSDLSTRLISWKRPII